MGHKRSWPPTHARLDEKVARSPIAAIAWVLIGGVASAARHVRSRRNFVDRSVVDLLCDLVDLDTEVADGTFDFEVPESELHRAEIRGSPIDPPWPADLLPRGLLSTARSKRARSRFLPSI